MRAECRANQGLIDWPGDRTATAAHGRDEAALAMQTLYQVGQRLRDAVPG